MITDTLVGAFLIFMLGAFVFAATVVLVVVAIFVWSSGWTGALWILAGTAFILAAHRLGDGAHISHPRSTSAGPKR